METIDQFRERNKKWSLDELTEYVQNKLETSKYVPCKIYEAIPYDTYMKVLLERKLAKMTGNPPGNMLQYGAIKKHFFKRNTFNIDKKKIKEKSWTAIYKDCAKQGWIEKVEPIVWATEEQIANVNNAITQHNEIIKQIPENKNYRVSKEINLRTPLESITDAGLGEKSLEWHPAMKKMTNKERSTITAWFKEHKKMVDYLDTVLNKKNVAPAGLTTDIRKFVKFLCDPNNRMQLIRRVRPETMLNVWGTLRQKLYTALELPL